MKEHSYKIADPCGLHARPASLIFMEARKYACAIELIGKEQKADCKNLLAIMEEGGKGGEELTFCFTGEDEEAALAGMRAVLERI